MTRPAFLVESGRERVEEVAVQRPAEARRSVMRDPGGAAVGDLDDIAAAAHSVSELS
ncbi:hypothetical protein GCM10023194_05530 [Planotetraspora phitsanulokensis]|uniref:Uncharacterized protein n=1 Tax=Planotetraspora phitsanulokensis TaxID=575192 RepID=A0A8J3XFL1_9ACTN|nr:hypothetical protein Pph01_40520 [Planotetraspora phitsanulokensis]